VTPCGVVVVLDPVAGLLGEVGVCGPGAGVDEFLLVGREERFGDGVVEIPVRPSDRLIPFFVQ